MKGFVRYFFRVTCLICGLCFCCSSCARTERTCEVLLGELMGMARELPAGQLYYARAEEGSAEYPSAALLEALYGEESIALFDALEDYALYLSSFAVPCEIAVIRAYSSDDANSIAAMGLQRIESLRLALRGTDFCESEDSAFVICHGKYVVIMIAEHAEALRDEALSLLRT